MGAASGCRPGLRDAGSAESEPLLPEARHRGNEYHFEEYSDKKLVQETEEKLLKYLADENPDLAAMVTKLETNWWYQEGENLYLHYWEEPENLDRDAVDFVVRVAPEWRIEFFSCVGNG